MERIPLETQTLYAELLEQLTTLEARRSVGALAGGFTTKKIKGKPYYYFQYSVPGGQQKQVYVGAASPVLDRLVAEHQEQREVFQADQRNIERLCAQLRVGGVTVSPHAPARVLRSLSDAGLFRVQGVLVGTHAFAALGNLLGWRWDKGGLETQDIDIAWERTLDVAIPDLPSADIPNALERLEMGFSPVPPLDPRKPSTSFSVRGKSLRVDVLTPMRKSSEEFGSISLPKLGTAAKALRYLDYLIEGSHPAAIVDAGGVLVRVPDPARFAFHKLIVSQKRPAAEGTKKAKDLRQASLLITVLVEERPGDLMIAWENLAVRGKTWRTQAVAGMKQMTRQNPGTPGLKTLLDL